MRSFFRLAASFLLGIALISTAIPCGPGYITPLFDTKSAPENPYTDFAAGQLGIIKKTFRRSVLIAAYRYLSGVGLTPAEQKAMVEVWQAEIKNKKFTDNDVDEAVKAWVAKRKSVREKEEKLPDIYVERNYGGYDFFPNCTRNAFETATQTLADRIAASSQTDPNLQNWLDGQDQVFANCASGKQTPTEAPPGAPDWLKKDRAYQIAAASFYSLDYEEARKRFADIAQDSESPWKETAEYLVARTLVRQASLSKDEKRSGALYDEAERHLQLFVSSSGKFTQSAEGMLGLIKYRRRPRERVSELAKQVAFRGGNENFRQDVIDYTWLLDKFENEILTAEEKRKEEQKSKEADAISVVAANNSGFDKAVPNTNAAVGIANRNEQQNEGDIPIYLSSSDFKQNWTLYLDRNASEQEALAAAEKLVGSPLTEQMKIVVREGRRSGWVNGFSSGQQGVYEGGYYGEEPLTRALLPAHLRNDELTDWLYTFQMSDAESYLYSLKKFKEAGSELWLVAAITKADKSSTDLQGLIEAANNARRMSPSYPTIAYHQTRILLLQGKSADARKLIDEMLSSGDQLPVSARNSFIGLRLKLAETLDDFLRYSLKKPYAFDFGGDTGTIEEFVKEQKSWYDPEVHKGGREAYEAGVDEEFKDKRDWQDREMFNSDTVDVLNQHFPTAALIEVMRSPVLPEHLRERFAIAIWTRSYLLDNMATLLNVTPEVLKYQPELEAYMTRITAAKTQPAAENAVLFAILKNPVLTPYIEEGMGKSDNEYDQMGFNDWWCEPYDNEYNTATDSEQPKALPARPAALTEAQSKAAQAERKRLKNIGDAPKFLGAKVLEWAKRNPADKRVPEALYIMIGANGWTKYGCGNNEDLKEKLTKYLKKFYPTSEWTAKLIDEENQNPED